ncbi:hypothetical protein [Polyangium aurulentum]|uniref:hypothetical protein n=1 Tax=Polyangium aurulentum TaxID=2567896 RepID=UPI0010AE5457|nr:hypothetical protein [Polyangium aurulentum]UQA56095.1 hypothetical protein E8A73_032930 [Polyangium aurulentum]
MRKLTATVFPIATAALMGALWVASKGGPAEDVSPQEGALAASSCVGPARERQDCGWPGISDQQCWDMGCCFDASIPNVPHCYHWFIDGPDEGSGPPTEG